MHQSEQKKTTYRTIFSRHFRDVDELAEVLNSRRQIQFTQLSRGQFDCDLFFVEFEEAQFIFTRSFGSKVAVWTAISTSSWRTLQPECSKAKSSFWSDPVP